MKEITPEMFDLALMYLKSYGKVIKKIKVTSEFADHLEQICPPIYFDTESEGIIANFTGIPVVVDDTINDDYELEF